MKNLVFIIFLIIGAQPLTAQDSSQAKIDSMAQRLVGAWDFIDIVDAKGDKMDVMDTLYSFSAPVDVKNLQPVEPNITLNKNGSCILEYDPRLVSSGNWYLSAPDTLVLKIIVKKGSTDYESQRRNAPLFKIKLKYDENGNIINTHYHRIIKLEGDEMWIQMNYVIYYPDCSNIYRRKK